MKMSAKCFGIIALAVVIGLSFTACGDTGGDNSGNGGGGGTDTWLNVTSLSQVNGSWKAPSTFTGNNFQGNQGITGTANTTNYIITFNATAKTMTTSGTSTVTLSGGDIDTRWSSIKTNLQSMYNGANATVSFNDANHSYTLTFNNFSVTFPDDNITSMGLQINQNGTKLKVLQNGIEITYTKQ
jgi:hypothetical protein